ncbi:MAG: VOC family protein [bacterium]|nr:VOC family protein [bacterium]
MSGASRAHFILYVRDQEAARAFYESVLGAPPTLHAPGMTEFEIGAGAILGLMPERGITRLLDLPSGEMPCGGIRGEVYLVAASPESYHRRALAAGARELSAMAPRDWGHRAAYSLDPDGYVLAFAEPVAAGGTNEGDLTGCSEYS